MTPSRWPAASACASRRSRLSSTPGPCRRPCCAGWARPPPILSAICARSGGGRCSRASSAGRASTTSGITLFRMASSRYRRPRRPLRSPIARISTRRPRPSSRIALRGLEVHLHEKIGLRDGRHANNPWLQELPDPVTRVTWGNVRLGGARAGRRDEAGRWRCRNSSGTRRAARAARPGTARPAAGGDLRGPRLWPHPRRQGGQRRGRQRLPAAHRLQRLLPRLGRRLPAGSDGAQTAPRRHPAPPLDGGAAHRSRGDARRIPARSGGWQRGEAAPSDALGRAPPGGAPLGHGHRSQRLHRLLGLRRRLPGREQRRRGRPGRGDAQPRDALDPHRPLLRGPGGRPANGLPADDVPALRQRPVRDGLPGARHRRTARTASTSRSTTAASAPATAPTTARTRCGASTGSTTPTTTASTTT